jgi:hypothetical protein
VIEQYEVTTRGIRVNPNLDPRNDIFVAIRKHQERLAKGTTKEQIEQVLDS